MIKRKLFLVLSLLILLTSNAYSQCAITAITAGAQTACDPTINNYTQEITVTYSTPPGIGTLDVNGQSFPITGRPQTVLLTGFL